MAVNSEELAITGCDLDRKKAKSHR